jgi:zinc transporter ZupT
MRGRFGVDSARTAAALVAIGIGLHNFGEGLTMAAAYAAGLVALTTLLLVGFAVHNVTEGLAIVAPLAQTRVTVGALVALGVVAGAPTIVGAWTGVMAWSPTLAVVFFGLGAGAVVQVIWEIVGLIRHRGELSDRLVAGGFALGVLVMYGTAIFVAA